MNWLLKPAELTINTHNFVVIAILIFFALSLCAVLMDILLQCIKAWAIHRASKRCDDLIEKERVLQRLKNEIEKVEE